MQVEYHPLLKLKLRHDYFPQGNCPVVKVVPTQTTQAVMQQLGIRLVERDYGVELFYNNGSNRQGRLLEESQDQVIRLSFILRTSDPLFYNYTVLPTALFNGSIPHYSNLTATNDFGVHELPLLPAVSGNFQITANTPESELAIEDELGTTLYSYPDVAADAEDLFKPIAPAGGDGSAFTINLSRDSPGQYTLRENGDLHSTLLYRPANWQRGDLSLVTLYLGDTGDTGVHILNNGVVEPAEFTASFVARATKWRYHFIDAEGTHHDFKLMQQATEIVVAKPPDLPEMRALPDGSKALVLTVPKAITLRAQPKSLFALSVRAKGNPREFTIPLPSADANRINREHPVTTTDNAVPTAATSPPEGGPNQADPVFYSDMYVYL